MSLIKVDQSVIVAKANEQRIAELKQKLRETDYVSLPDYDKDKPEILADRQAWRDEIRQLEPTLNSEE